jgi:predicted protein tyrosine phosphatase
MQIQIPAVNNILDTLYIGGAIDAYPQAHALAQAGIRHILKLYQGDPHWPEPFIVLDHAIKDSSSITLEQLQRGVAFIHQQQQAGHPLLVACRYGVSRSSTFVLAYLVQEKGYDLSDAWHLLRSNHPLAHPARELWQSLLDHYRQPYTMADVEQWLIRG